MDKLAKNVPQYVRPGVRRRIPPGMFSCVVHIDKRMPDGYQGNIGVHYI